LVAIGDIELLAGARAEHVKRDDAGGTARIDLYDRVVLALAGQVGEQYVARDEAALLQRDLDRVRDLVGVEQLLREQLLRRRQLRSGGRGDG
jgi:hypothetical protein